MTGQRYDVGPLVVDLNALIDGQKVQRSSILFLAIAALMLVADGLDLGVIGYVGPGVPDGGFALAERSGHAIAPNMA